MDTNYKVLFCKKLNILKDWILIISYIIGQDESQDFYKKQQLRELAMLNSSSMREESPLPGGSDSPFGNSVPKRAKTDI